MASLWSSLAPPFATITGSTTSFSIPCSRIAVQTASMISVLASIPVFAACTPMSSTTASIWARITRTGTSWMSVTAIVFWAVMAVIADVPCTPNAANVFRSAWMPAPAPAPVHGRGDRDADETARVGAVQSGDETVVEEVRRRDHVAEEVCVVDEEETGGGAREPRGERKLRTRPPLEDEKAEEEDRGPRRRPQVREDQEVLIRHMQVAHQYRVGRKRGAEDSTAQRCLPALQSDAHRQSDQTGRVDVEVVGPDLANDHEDEEGHRHPYRCVRADDRKHALAGGELRVDGRQQQAKEAEENHRHGYAHDWPERD